MIKIYTDSTSYIPQHLLDQHRINVFPLSVSLDGKSFVETEISNEDFFAMVRQSDQFPKSSQPSVESMIEHFREDAAAGHSVVAVLISSKMSGTYQTALMARQMVIDDYPDARIEIVDSQSNCMQLGVAVLAGAEAIDAGADMDGVLDAIHATIKRSRFIFIPENLEFLEKGGRIGKANALLGNILSIIPILTVQYGETTSMAKVRTKKRAIGKLIDILMKDIEELGIQKITVHHIDCLDEAKKLIVKLKENVDFLIETCSIGPVIGAHVGPGALGIVYVTDQPHPMNT